MPERPFETVPFNFAPGINKKPVCRFFNLMRLAAVLAGENLDQNNFFCGLGRYIEINPHQDYPTDYKTIYRPISSCQEIYLRLKEVSPRSVEAENVLKQLELIVNRYGETNSLGHSATQCPESPMEAGGPNQIFRLKNYPIRLRVSPVRAH